MSRRILFNIFIFISTINFIDCIFGGKDVSISQFPYQVSVRLYDNHHCGGSIIDESTIVTAAHCVHGENYFKFSVRVGATYHNEGQQYLVMDIIEHPSYNIIVEYDFDVAILKLYTNLKYNSHIQPIALQEQYREVPSDTISWVSGWGASKGSIISPNLKAVENTVISNDDCITMYEFHTNQISNRMICAHTSQCHSRSLYECHSHPHSCKGDSGGPLVFNNTLIGVVSWGLDCNHPEYPGVYTKVSAVSNWIMKNKNKRSHFCNKL